MKNKTLHIVSFDHPYPPNYGGVIDIYYKIRALHATGVRIILHVFLYDGKEPASELADKCHKIYYYNRKRFTNPFTGDIPYIVTTRSDEQLLRNLKKDKYPILFEGLHTTYFLSDKSLKERLKIVRTHNVEHLYYKALEEAESGFFKKYFFRVESERLLNYEKILKHADVILPISPQETSYYKKDFSNTIYVPAFHSNTAVNSVSGRGKFILYHGNLGVGENNKAALYLVHEVFSRLDVPVVVAGNNPSRQLKQAIKGNPYISLADKISSDDILQLVADAHANILVTFQSTGIKLKLLNSLFRGRHCIVNEAMVQDTGLEDLCLTGKTATGIIKHIKQIWDTDFTSTDIEKRKTILNKEFDNIKNAQIISNLIN